MRNEHIKTPIFSGLIRSFFRLAAFVIGGGDFHFHVVRMGFEFAGVGDADKAGVGRKFFEVMCPAVAHAATKSAKDLEDDVFATSFYRHFRLNPFGDEFPFGGLEITIGGAMPHGL